MEELRRYFEAVQRIIMFGFKFRGRPPALTLAKQAEARQRRLERATL